MEQWWTDLAEHDGLVLRDRVLGSGVDPDQLVVALRTGRLVRVQRGVYAQRGAPPAALALARAAVLSCGVDRAVASHTTAARVHRLAVPDRPRTEHVTVPRELRRTRRRDLVFHGRPLALGDVVAPGGVPVTAVVRTLVDLAAALPRLEAVWCLDDALRRGLVTRTDLQAAARGRGLPGVGSRVARADGLAESILETAARLALGDAGVPLPVPQLVVRDASGAAVARLDGGYPELRLALELDGRSVHSAPAAVFRDRRRQNALEALGWRVLRFTWWDVVHDTDGFVAVVRSAVARAAA
ncbi:DUF559 domain-containing protein [Rhodococcus aerolatus]